MTPPDYFEMPSGLFLVAVAVAAHELIYATCGVDEFLFACEERVR